MEDDLKKNGRRPKQKYKKMEDDIKKTRRLSFGIQQNNQNQHNWL